MPFDATLFIKTRVAPAVERCARAPKQSPFSRMNTCRGARNPRLELRFSRLALASQHFCRSR